MNNLLQSVNHLFNGDIINKMAAAFGESEGGITKALSGAVPAVLASFVSKANEPNGASHLLNLSQDAANAGVISNVSSMFTGEGNILDKGLDMIRELLGSRLETVVQAIANFSGIRSSSASSLLSMAAPMALGALGNEARKHNLSAAGLASYLNDQKAGILNALPAGLGLGSLFGTGNAATNYEQIKVNYQTTEKRDTKGTNWLLPLILILLAVAAILYFMKGCRNDAAPGTVGEVKDTMVSMVDKVKEKMREMVQLDVANNLKIDAYKGGIEDQLIVYLRDADAPIEKDRWFDFDDLNFEVGSSVLTSSSMRQVKNIANILNAFPKAKIKIGGYTDKTGDDSINKKISQERAEAVYNALLAEGVKKEQLTGAEGYGSEFAKAAATDPETVREKDRRISINVREK